MPDLFILLENILTEHSSGISEWDLVKQLKNKGLPPFAEANLGDSLVMFQVHFLLFHLLYQLKIQRNQKGRGLTIHCLKIQLTPRVNLQPGLVMQDPLQDYYLDWGQFEKTGQTEVTGMLQQFWSRYQRHDSQTEALSILGLPEGVGLPEIKARYRQLAHKLHPDSGGSGEGFEKITWAKEALVSRLSE